MESIRNQIYIVVKCNSKFRFLGGGPSQCFEGGLLPTGGFLPDGRATVRRREGHSFLLFV